MDAGSNSGVKTSAGWRNYLFTYRSYTPIPFLVVMVLFMRPTAVSMIAGLAVAVAGEAIRLWGVCYAGSETRTTGRVGGTQLVTSGPYAYVRNPLYIGNILMYVGVGIMSNALMPYLPLIALAYFVFQYSGIVTLEEEYLSETFPTWEEYKSEVGRFIPRTTQYKGGMKLEPDFLRALRSERSSMIALGSVSLVLCVFYVWRGVA